MKKLAVLVIMVLMAGWLAACGGSSGNTAGSTANNSSTASGSSSESTAPPSSSSSSSSSSTSSSSASSSSASPSDSSPPTAAVGPTPSPTAVAGMDQATGLEINPNPAPQTGEFIVEGPVTAVNAIPQDKPTFTIRVPGGISYTIHAQPLSEILTEDGTSLRPHEFRSGLIMRATVRFDATVQGGTPGFVSDDMVILLNEK